jgi:hypothetical protein
MWVCPAPNPCLGKAAAKRWRAGGKRVEEEGKEGEKMEENGGPRRIARRQRTGAGDGCPGGAEETGVQQHVRGLPRRQLRAGRMLAAAVAAALIGTVRGGLEHLLTVMNKLQDVTSVIQDSGQATGIELPQIVVVGTQSSGKSSVSACAGGAACHARLCAPTIDVLCLCCVPRPTHCHERDRAP